MHRFGVGREKINVEIKKAGSVLVLIKRRHRSSSCEYVPERVVVVEGNLN